MGYGKASEIVGREIKAKSQGKGKEGKGKEPLMSHATGPGVTLSKQARFRPGLSVALQSGACWYQVDIFC
jgi:hypothetical protein